MKPVVTGRELAFAPGIREQNRSKAADRLPSVPRAPAWLDEVVDLPRVFFDHRALVTPAMGCGCPQSTAADGKRVGKPAALRVPIASVR